MSQRGAARCLLALLMLEMWRAGTGSAESTAEFSKPTSFTPIPNQLVSQPVQAHLKASYPPPLCTCSMAELRKAMKQGGSGGAKDTASALWGGLKDAVKEK